MTPLSLMILRSLLRDYLNITASHVKVEAARILRGVKVRRESKRLRTCYEVGTGSFCLPINSIDEKVIQTDVREVGPSLQNVVSSYECDIWSVVIVRPKLP
jgi:hypothetical protein